METEKKITSFIINSYIYTYIFLGHLQKYICADLIYLPVFNHVFIVLHIFFISILIELTFCLFFFFFWIEEKSSCWNVVFKGCLQVGAKLLETSTALKQVIHNPPQPQGPVIPFHAYLSRIHLFGRGHRLISRFSLPGWICVLPIFFCIVFLVFSPLSSRWPAGNSHAVFFLSFPPFLSSYVQIRREMRPKIDKMRLPSDGQTGRLEYRRLIGSAGGDVKPRYPAEFTEGRKSHHLSRDFPLVSPVNSKV